MARKKKRSKQAGKAAANAKRQKAQDKKAGVVRTGKRGKK